MVSVSEAKLNATGCHLPLSNAMHHEDEARPSKQESKAAVRPCLPNLRIWGLGIEDAACKGLEHRV
jgi:hypothetical protein